MFVLCFARMPSGIQENIPIFTFLLVRRQLSSADTILVKTLRRLCVLGEENVIVVDPPPPLNSVGCYKSNTLYISCTLYEPQLCLGGWRVGEKSS